jgi:hypothetical protein
MRGYLAQFNVLVASTNPHSTAAIEFPVDWSRGVLRLKRFVRKMRDIEVNPLLFGS